MVWNHLNHKTSESLQLVRKISEMSKTVLKTTNQKILGQHFLPFCEELEDLVNVSIIFKCIMQSTCLMMAQWETHTKHKEATTGHGWTMFGLWLDDGWIFVANFAGRYLEVWIELFWPSEAVSWSHVPWSETSDGSAWQQRKARPKGSSLNTTNFQEISSRLDGIYKTPNFKI